MGMHVQVIVHLGRLRKLRALDIRTTRKAFFLNFNDITFNLNKLTVLFYHIFPNNLAYYCWSLEAPKFLFD